MASYWFHLPWRCCLYGPQWRSLDCFGLCGDWTVTRHRGCLNWTMPFIPMDPARHKRNSTIIFPAHRNINDRFSDPTNRLIREVHLPVCTKLFQKT